jgi:hypothetical protein
MDIAKKKLAETQEELSQEATEKVMSDFVAVSFSLLN